MSYDESKSVLIVGDCEVTLSEVEHWVAAETTGFDRAVTKDRAIRLQKGAQYQLVILCFESLQKSSAMRDLLAAEFAARDERDRPVMVVLCTKQEMDQAFELCDSGLLDDYVLFRPLYDPYRLQLVIRNGLRCRRAQQRNQQMRSEMQAVSKDVHELAGFSRDIQRNSRALTDRAKHRLGQMAVRLGAGAEEVRSMLAERPADAIADAWQQELQRSLETFCEETLQNQLAAAEDDMEKWIVEWADACSDRSEALAGSLEQTCSSSLRSATTVLLVEDEPFSRKFTRQMLANHGYELLLAENGRGAITRAVAESPDLILLDLKLPDINGDQVVRHLRENPRTRNIPVIVLSEVSEKGIVTELIRLGVAGYQIKPPNEQRLLEQLQSTLAG